MYRSERYECVEKFAIKGCRFVIVSIGEDLGICYDNGTVEESF
jgi:hypothetical protein